MLALTPATRIFVAVAPVDRKRQASCICRRARKYDTLGPSVGLRLEFAARLRGAAPLVGVGEISRVRGWRLSSSPAEVRQSA
jgi:hypothetical protein